MEMIAMMMLRSNEQDMMFSVPKERKQFYKYKDGQKEIDFVDEDGTIYYVFDGEPVLIYSTPEDLKAVVSGKIKDSMAQDFGVGNDPNYAVMITGKGYYKIPRTSYIWKDSIVEYKEKGEEMIVDVTSADYEVVASNLESLNEDVYLLRKIQKPVLGI